MCNLSFYRIFALLPPQKPVRHLGGRMFSSSPNVALPPSAPVWTHVAKAPSSPV